MIDRIAVMTLILTVSLHAQSNPHRRMDRSCTDCHGTENWAEIRFDHANTGFPLEGHHTNLNCSRCHTVDDFARINSRCTACHTDVHGNRLGLDCDHCHTPLGWSLLDPQKAHAATTFQLLGVHATLDCASCHRGDARGEFVRPVSDCIACHEDDYASAAPDHRLLDFGPRCDDCHSLFAWKPADYPDHDTRFPIHSGAHGGEWDNCSNCHPVSGDYAQFSCTHCHAHRKSRMDKVHDDEHGYIYDSRECLRCHPRGRE